MNNFKLNLVKIAYKIFNTFELREKRAIHAKLKYFQVDEKHFPDSPVIVGIIKERWGMHSHYIDACEELKFSYCLIDLFASNWKDQIKKAKFSFLVVRPSVQYAPWKAMFDDRIALIKDDYPIFPNYLSLWLWESKIRTYEWLEFNNLPHPKTTIFYSHKELQTFANTCEFPIVYKANIGSGSSGVVIIKNKTQLLRQSNQCFVQGIRTYRKHKLDKEHGFLVLQSFLPEVREWRIFRMGRFYFAFEKLKKGQFHSGSKEFGYGMPPLSILNLVKNVTDQHEFKYVSIDVFIDQDENLYINEIQPYFGQENDRELLVIDGKTGRLYFEDGEWKFEAGEYCKNNLANLRIKEIIQELAK